MIKRYRHKFRGDLVEDDNGDYVEHQDYAELLGIYSELCAAIDALPDSVSAGQT